MINNADDTPLRSRCSELCLPLSRDQPQINNMAPGRPDGRAGWDRTHLSHFVSFPLRAAGHHDRVLPSRASLPIHSQSVNFIRQYLASCGGGVPHVSLWPGIGYPIKFYLSPNQ